MLVEYLEVGRLSGVFWWRWVVLGDDGEGGVR